MSDLHMNNAEGEYNPFVDELAVLRRAREARRVAEEAADEEKQEIWILPPGGATDEQMSAVAKLIDAERMKS